MAVAMLFMAHGKKKYGRCSDTTTNNTQDTIRTRLIYLMQPYDTVCQLGCSVSFVYERVRCNEDSSKTGNMCGERIYIVTRGVHTTNLFS